jgi:hypothetical protein
MLRRVSVSPAHYLARAAILGAMLAPILVVTSRDASAQGWAGYGSDPQHTCLSKVASQLPQQIRWSMPVDLNPPFQGGELFIHYASPLITLKNNVIVGVRTDAGFRFTAVRGQDGTTIWQQPLATDYVFPPHNWIPVCGGTLVSGGQKLAIPGPGGTVYVRTNPDRETGVVTQVPFYTSLATYNANKGRFDASVFICTPITADSIGNLYFGYSVHSATLGAPATGGLAKISSTGVGSFITAADLSGDPGMQKVVYNCAPAISNDGQTVYVAVNNQVDGLGNSGVGYLVSVNCKSLSKTTAKKVRLKDVRGGDALLPDDGSAAPTVGPDGDVYFGVLERSIPQVNDDRGWMLHFSGDLATTKTPGSFGWDNTASIVPASAVRAYTGHSSYLILTKYNNYADFGPAYGDGQNKMAILDPNDQQDYTLPVGQPRVSVMKEILTVVGATQNASLPGVREWCVNSSAVDPINRCAVVNSEDGNVYRWDFDTNTLVSQLALAQATGEAYTPTVIGPDGAVYAINRAMLNCCVRRP